jgi:hypothetical protein
MLKKILMVIAILSYASFVHADEYDSFQQQIFRSNTNNFQIAEPDNVFGQVPRALLFRETDTVINDFYFNNIQLFKLFKYPTPNGRFLGEY